MSAKDGRQTEPDVGTPARVAGPAGPRRAEVLVIGAGFGGLEVAKALGAAGIDTSVVDRRNHHLFQPLLYQVATAALSAADIAEPIRRILRRHASVSVLFAPYPLAASPDLRAGGTRG